MWKSLPGPTCAKYQHVQNVAQSRTEKELLHEMPFKEERAGRTIILTTDGRCQKVDMEFTQTKSF